MTITATPTGISKTGPSPDIAAITITTADGEHTLSIPLFETYDISTDYPISVDGVSDIASVLVNPNNTVPSLSITASKLKLNAGEEVTLTANVTDIDPDDSHTYLWSTGETTQQIIVTATTSSLASQITRSCVANDGTDDSNIAEIEIDVAAEVVSTENVINNPVFLTTYTVDNNRQIFAYRGRANITELKFKPATSVGIQLDSTGYFDFDKNNVTRVEVLMNGQLLSSTGSDAAYTGGALKVRLGAFDVEEAVHSLRVIVYIGSDEQGLVMCAPGLNSNLSVNYRV